MTRDTLVTRLLEFATFEWSFAVDGLVAGVVIGAMCGAVGVYMVLRRLSLVGDATGHATLPGVCIAFLLTGSKALPILLAGALLSGVAANLAIAAIVRTPRTRPDATIGVVLSVAFGLGIVLLSFVQTSPTGAQSGLQSFLFGSAAAVSRAQAVGLTGMAVGVLALLGATRRTMTLAAFDPVYAHSVGVPTRAIERITLMVLAVVVVVSIKTVGVVLVAAMLVIPPSTALLVCKRIPTALVSAAACGAFSGAFGALVSFLFEGVSTGPAMVLAAAALFFATLAARGLATAVRVRWPAAQRGAAPRREVAA